MSKWLAKFSGENQEIQPDIPDIVSSVSGLSGPFSTSEGENGHERLPNTQKLPTLGAAITWRGADGKQRGPARVDLIHTDSDGTVWAFVTLSDAWAAVNTKYVLSIEASAGIDTL